MEGKRESGHVTQGRRVSKDRGYLLCQTQKGCLIQQHTFTEFCYVPRTAFDNGFNGMKIKKCWKFWQLGGHWHLWEDKSHGVVGAEI